MVIQALPNCHSAGIDKTDASENHIRLVNEGLARDPLLDLTHIVDGLTSMHHVCIDITLVIASVYM